MQLSVQHAARAARVVVEGEVDLATVDDLVRAADEALRDAPQRLELDLAGVSFIDSVGIGALVTIRNTTRADGIVLVLGNVSRPVRRLLQIANLDTVFELVDD